MPPDDIEQFMNDRFRKIIEETLKSQPEENSRLGHSSPIKCWNKHNFIHFFTGMSDKRTEIREAASRCDAKTIKQLNKDHEINWSDIFSPASHCGEEYFIQLKKILSRSNCPRCPTFSPRSCEKRFYCRC